MTPFISCTAAFWRDGVSWVISIDRLEERTEAARLSEVDGAARRLISTVTGQPAARLTLALEPRVPASISAVLDVATAVRQETDPESKATVAVRRALTRRLTDHGYGTREIAVVLGVSYAGARQLAGEPVEGSGHRHRAVPAVAVAVKPHTGYQHEALLYRDRDEFLAGALPFVRDGLRLGQPVMVALIRPRLELLRAALGPVAGRISYLDMAELGGNPARIIPAWLEFLAEYGGSHRPVRGLGEPQWVGRHPEEAIECQLHEGLLNLAVDPDVPLWLRCPYDVARLPATLIDAALRSHPAVVEGGAYRGSTSYGGLHHVNSLFRSELPPAPAGSTRLVFAARDIWALRSYVGRLAGQAGLVPERCRDLTQAVGEIAANSVRYGGGKGELVTWFQPGALVCEVTDRGRLGNPMVGRRAPALEQEKGRGLWLANQISDLVQIRSTPKGTAARVFAWL